MHSAREISTGSSTCDLIRNGRPARLEGIGVILLQRISCHVSVLFHYQGFLLSRVYRNVITINTGEGERIARSNFYPGPRTTGTHALRSRIK